MGHFSGMMSVSTEQDWAPSARVILEITSIYTVNKSLNMFHYTDKLLVIHSLS